MANATAHVRTNMPQTRVFDAICETARGMDVERRGNFDHFATRVAQEIATKRNWGVIVNDRELRTFIVNQLRHVRGPTTELDFQVFTLGPIRTFAREKEEEKTRKVEGELAEGIPVQVKAGPSFEGEDTKMTLTVTDERGRSSILDVKLTNEAAAELGRALARSKR